MDSNGGRIESLFRYPVKSMLGEAVATCHIDERGIVGDRAYALVDRATGKVASAKRPRRWNLLFECRAAYVDEPDPGRALPAARITLPDGTIVHTDDAECDDELSNFVGVPVRVQTVAPDHPVIEVEVDTPDGEPDGEGRLADEAIAIVAPGTFFDAAPLHVLTTATLARLAEAAPTSRITAARFRPNIVVATPEPTGFVENQWVGRTLHLGAEVAASVFLLAPRCVMITLEQPGLPHDRSVLQTVAAHNRVDIPGLGPRSCAGIYALITNGGVVRCADSVTVA